MTVFPNPIELFSVTNQLYMSATMPAIGLTLGTVDLYSGSGVGSELLQVSGTAIQMNGAAEVPVSTSGSWDKLAFLGPADQLGVVEMPTEDHAASPSLLDPVANPLQGANTLEWDVFPTPAVVEPTLPSGQRDLTRYHKAYSFSRGQPVRIRLIRR